MDIIFKLHASQGGKIMGEMGLTAKQLITFQELHERKNNPLAKALTPNMEAEYEKLKTIHEKPELPQTAKTFLHEFYAGDNDEIFSKYVNKGNIVESDNIDFMAEVLGFGMAEKNQEPPKEDDYFIGTPDVIMNDYIIDIKSSWNIKTLQEQAKGIDPDYEKQLQIYMHLYGKKKAILFFGLQDTPEDANFGFEVIYSHLPNNERWIAYKINYDPVLIEQIQARILMCRIYLEQYDLFIKSKIGKLIKQPSLL
jgi:hypothetical protein